MEEMDGRSLSKQSLHLEVELLEKDEKTLGTLAFEAAVDDGIVGRGNDKYLDVQVVRISFRSVVSQCFQKGCAPLRRGILKSNGTSIPSGACIGKRV